MKKYDVWFCSCGHIHTMPMEYLSWLEEDYQNRSVYQICQSCGTVRRVWLDEYDDGFSVNTCYVSNLELPTTENCRVIINDGIKVPLVRKNKFESPSDYTADFYYNNHWSNENSERRDVDTNQLIKDVNDEEILRSIAGYVSGIDWSGTPYDI